ncbi:MAG TPA: helix-turn-helix transcriptional regulator [Solirubrobacterales bacterium]|nr:helix-turn-helix transcriptional regulator [Solirubrobacterales bacterium]
MTQPDRVLQGLGEALHAVRSKRGVSQETLSLETGVHRNYIGGIERGERSPSVAAVAKLADALEISLADLFRKAERSVS